MKIFCLSCTLITGLCFIFITAFTSPAIMAQAPVPAEIFVSPQGNDSSPGTISQPLQTITQAQSLIRGLKTANGGKLPNNYIVYLRAGIYPLSSALVFSQEDSGDAAYSITYQSYQQERVVISGGLPLYNWTIDTTTKPGKTIWKTTVPKDPNTGQPYYSRQLYVDDVPATRARSLGGLTNASRTATGYTTTDNLTSWQNLQDIEVVRNIWWMHFRCRIQSAASTAITMQQPCFTNEYVHSMSHDLPTPSYIENALELLDQPGEWYENRLTGNIYYYPKANEVLNQTSFVLPVLERLIDLRGTASQPISNLRFINLNFAYTTWLSPSLNSGYVSYQANYYFPEMPFSSFPGPTQLQKMPGTVHGSYVTSLTFQGNHFYDLGNSALVLENGAQNNQIIGNRFIYSAGTPISLGEINKAKATASTDITRNNLISNNLIHQSGFDYPSHVGIFAGYTEATTITHNEVMELPYSGISIGWGWGSEDPTVAKNNLITRNLVSHMSQSINDAGSLYSLSAQPGNEYSYNVLINQQNEYGALYLDDQSRNINVHHNVIFGNKRTALFKGGSHVLQNNYWQDRGNNDIWFCNWDGCNLCGPNNEPCGSNTVTNNTVITDLSQAPSDILNNAGLEPAYENLLTPVIISPSTTVKPGNQVISWSPVLGAKQYLLRIDDLTNPWDNCHPRIMYPEDRCLTLDATTPSFTYPFVENHNYNIWLHTVYGPNGEHSSPSSIRTLATNQVSPSPTPTNTPAPTYTPTPTPIPFLPGDLDQDQDVDYTDYTALIANFNSVTCGNIADINLDCSVNLYDYNLLFSNYTGSL